MKICVTHVDARTGIPCTIAPMSHGPAFPKVKGLIVEFGNQTQWPTNEPLFFGSCDDDADLTIAGVVRSLTPEQYEFEQTKENDVKAMQVRQQRDYLLQTRVDSLNAIRWSVLTAQEKTDWTSYREALLNVPAQAGFPWTIDWPTQP